ncbi:MAG: hypothetical protein K2K20_11980, partial [Lachnospiraceae bacterium]|nr:hypothetical protein [Lachnospiraceae bacterium]
MDKDVKKAKRLVIILFVICLCIALICFGIAVYLVVTNRESGTASQNLANITKSIFMIGVFFLVLGFGYTLPDKLS